MKNQIGFRKRKTINPFITKKKSSSKLFNPLIASIFLAFVVINFANPEWFGNFSFQTNQARNLYKEAMNYQQNKDYKSAYDSYNKIPKGYVAYDAVLFQIAKCAANLEDEKTAIKSLKILIHRYSGSPLKPLASYALGQAFVRIQDNESAKKQFLEIIKDYPNTDYAVGSYYYLGQLNRNSDKKEALRYWSKYLSKSPDGRFALDCVDGIKSLKINLSSSDKLNLTKALYLAQKYKEAQNYANQIPVSEGWYYKARLSQISGNKKNALNLYKNGIEKYSNSGSQAELGNAMVYYVSLYPQPAVKSWSELINMSKRCRDFALFHKAQIVPANVALSLYQEIADKYPDSYYAPESLWTLFWNKFNKNDYNTAIKLGKTHIKRYKNTNTSPKIMFWTAKAYERVNQKIFASNYYSKLLSMYPDSYYAFRADGRLTALNLGTDPKWITDKSDYITEIAYKSSIPYSYRGLQRKFGYTGAELMQVEDFDTLSIITDNDPFIESWIKLKEGLKSRSIVLAREGMKKMMPKPDSNDSRWKLIYPLYFTDSINNYSSNSGLDPVIVLSLIREESYFNPLAVSSSNARGLMQLLPGTAKDVARWNYFGSINEFMLFNPETNIKFGTAYLRHVKGKLNDSILYAVAAYNGGPGAVERWLKTINSNDPDQFVENIPYDQTRDYVKKVFGSYWNYKRIYGF